MYLEAMEDDIYERNYQNWKDGGRKGNPPKPPRRHETSTSDKDIMDGNVEEGQSNIKESSGPTPGFHDAPDIGDMFRVEE